MIRTFGSTLGTLASLVTLSMSIVLSVLVCSFATLLIPSTTHAQMLGGDRNKDVTEKNEAVEQEGGNNTRQSRSRMSSSLRRSIEALGNDIEKNLRIPILLGVSLSQLYDSWDDPRANGRTHEGIDILTNKGAFVVSPTDAVVSSIGFGENGGNYVYTYNPGGERLYFAHLDKVAEGLKTGDTLKLGDLIGYVGNTGNASGGPPHLHLGIYNRGAQNPFPRITREFTTQERIDALEKLAERYDRADTKLAFVQYVVAQNPMFFAQARSEVKLPPIFAYVAGQRTVAITPQTPTTPQTAQVTPQAGSWYAVFTRDLELGAVGADVKALQEFLNRSGAPIAASGLGSPGNETTYFGALTKAALIAYQQKVGITPTSGYFGPITRAHIQAL